MFLNAPDFEINSQQYTLFMREKVMNSARWPFVAWIRYMDSVMADMMVIVYFPQLTRCGKMLRVSL